MKIKNSTFLSFCNESFKKNHYPLKIQDILRKNPLGLATETKNKFILTSTTNLKAKENKTRWKLRRYKKILSKTKNKTISLKK